MLHNILMRQPHIFGNNFAKNVSEGTLCNSKLINHFCCHLLYISLLNHSHSRAYGRGKKEYRDSSFQWYSICVYYEWLQWNIVVLWMEKMAYKRSFIYFTFNFHGWTITTTKWFEKDELCKKGARRKSMNNKHELFHK